MTDYKNKYKHYYFVFTALFVAVSSLIVFFYYSQGKSLIDYGGDGFRQHYRALVYYHDYLHNILDNLIHNHVLKIPQWDFVIGEGSDILQTFHYYGMGDVIDFFVIFFKRDYIYIFYDLATFIRMYLAGIFFSLFCIYKKKEFLPVLNAALLYSFSSYSLFALSAHTFFISGLMYLPLVLLGVEMIIDNHNKAVLPVAVFFASMSNIYFFFIVVLLTVIYVVTRLLLIDETTLNKLKMLANIAIYSFLGLMMSAVIFLPMSFIILTNSRMSANMPIDLFYEASHYRQLLTSLIFDYDNYYGNYSLLGLWSLIILFKKRDKTLMTLLALLTVFMIFPIFGKIFNAMTHPTTRWVFSLTFLFCYMISDAYNEMTDITKKDLYFFVISIVYSVICILLDKEFYQIHIMYLLISLISFAIIIFVPNRKIIHFGLLLLVLFHIVFAVTFKFSPIWWNYVRNGSSISTINSDLKSETVLLDDVDDSSFYRFTGNHLTDNVGINSKFSSSQYYWSIANDYVMNNRKNLALLDTNNHHYDNYDDRYILNVLASNRYFITNDERMVPYGYQKNKSIDGYTLYTSDQVMPLVYGYSNAIDTEEWLKMSIADRQETLAYNAVIDSDDIKLPYNDRHDNSVIESVLSSDDVAIENNKIIVTKKASISVTGQSEKAGEYYLIVEGLDSLASANWDVELPNGSIKTMQYKSIYNAGNDDRHDFLVNLGYYDGFDSSINIDINGTGTFSYKNIYLVCQPISEDIKNLNCVDIEEMNINQGDVDMHISVGDNKLLCFGIPYGKGWNLTIDGKTTDVINVNGMYIGAYVEKGAHQISLRYHTPLFGVGAIISLFSIVGYILIVLKATSRYRQNKNQ